MHISISTTMVPLSIGSSASNGEQKRMSEVHRKNNLVHLVIEKLLHLGVPLGIHLGEKQVHSHSLPTARAPSIEFTRTTKTVTSFLILLFPSYSLAKNLRVFQWVIVDQQLRQPPLHCLVNVICTTLKSTNWKDLPLLFFQPIPGACLCTAPFALTCAASAGIHLHPKLKLFL